MNIFTRGRFCVRYCADLHTHSTVARPSYKHPHYSTSHTHHHHPHTLSYYAAFRQEFHTSHLKLGVQCQQHAFSPTIHRTSAYTALERTCPKIKCYFAPCSDDLQVIITLAHKHSYLNKKAIENGEGVK